MIPVKCPGCGRRLKAVPAGVSERLCRDEKCRQRWTVAVKGSEVVFRKPMLPPRMGR